MSSVAERERIALRRRTNRSQTAASTRSRPRLLGGGVLWIVLFACLLAGVVAVNVTVLRLNLALDGTRHERAQLKADIATIRSGLSSAGATARIEGAAQDELGLVQADPDSMVYVTLEAK